MVVMLMLTVIALYPVKNNELTALYIMKHKQ